MMMFQAINLYKSGGIFQLAMAGMFDRRDFPWPNVKILGLQPQPLRLGRFLVISRLYVTPEATIENDLLHMN